MATPLAEVRYDSQLLKYVLGATSRQYLNSKNKIPGGPRVNRDRSISCARLWNAAEWLSGGRDGDQPCCNRVLQILGRIHRATSYALTSRKYLPNGAVSWVPWTPQTCTAMLATLVAKEADSSLAAEDDRWQSRPSSKSRAAY